MYHMRSVTLKAVCLALVLFAATDVSLAGTYSGGDGTEQNPYLISSVDDLLELRDMPTDYSAYFQQTDDIDLSSLSFYGAVIAPDVDQSTSGYQGTSFTGKYDGMGFTISGLNVNTVFGNAAFIGLFGYNQGDIVNLNVGGNINLYQGTYVGTLCGRNSGVITGCHSSGTITCEDAGTSIGGLVGLNYNGSISHSSSSVAITCIGNGSYIGGFVGQHGMYSQNRMIEYCCSFGGVSVGDNSTCIGGFCGYIKAEWSLYNDFFTIDTLNCYATGDVTCGNDSEKIGGFCGEMYSGGGHQWGDGHARIDKCYSIGEVTTGSGCTEVGGFNGIKHTDYGTVTVARSTWNTDLCSQASSDGGDGLTDDQMKDINVYLMYGWDFCGFVVNGTEDIWVMPGVPLDCQIPDPTYEYPQFIWQKSTGEVELVSISISGPDTVLENSTTKYICTVIYSDGSTKDISDQADWSVSDPNLATIDSMGMLTSLEVTTTTPQSVTITAQYEGLEVSKEITIEPVVPDVTGLLLCEADSILRENGLRVGEITIDYSGGADMCSVVSSQNPVGGTPVQTTEKVDLVIYLGG